MQNIGKINLLVSYDAGESWEQADSFYKKIIIEECSVDTIVVSMCNSVDVTENYTNPMVCEAMGNIWNYSENKCATQILEKEIFEPHISTQDSIIQDYTNDPFALSAQISNGEPTALDTVYIRGEGIEINHNTLVKIIVFDRGDYFDIHDSIPEFNWSSAINTVNDISDEMFTISANNVTRNFEIGWHLFGPPVQPYNPRMNEVFQEPHGFGEWGYEWIVFGQSGSFTDIHMQMGYGYYLNNKVKYLAKNKYFRTGDLGYLKDTLSNMISSLNLSGVSPPCRRNVLPSFLRRSTTNLTIARSLMNPILH